MPTWDSYFDCVNSLTDAGLAVIRMGQSVDDLIDPNSCKIVDYASTSRSEFGDVWLLGNCKFVIAAATGILWPASTFNRPAVKTDSYDLLNTSYGENDLTIPQLAWSRSEKNFKLFSWLIKQGQGWAQKRSLIEGDVEVVKNTVEEINEVVLEMNQRIDGTWIETDEDVELQSRFKKLRENEPKWQVQEGVRIGANFLRRYQHLL